MLTLRPPEALYSENVSTALITKHEEGGVNAVVNGMTAAAADML